MRSRLALLIACLVQVSTVAQQRQAGPGSPCVNSGTLSLVDGSPLFCEDNHYRWALPSDVPPAPDGGYTSRPEWFPALDQIFRANDPPSCPITGRVTFTHPVVLPEHVTRILPQATMIGDHVTPIDHGYIGVTPLDKTQAQKTEADYVPVYAPADGEIIEVSSLGSPTSTRIVIAHGCSTYSVLMVVNRLSGALAALQDDLAARGFLNPHIRVQAGTEIARQRDNPIDFSVHDGNTWLPGYVFPFSYIYGESWKPYTVDPWPYFSPDLADFYRSRMQRVAEPRWGRIDLDINGTAAGTWFLDGTMGYTGQLIEAFRGTERPVGGEVPGKRYYSWSHLAIVRHVVQPSRWMFSTGWWRDPAGDPQQLMLIVPAGKPEPDALTAEAGAVVYEVWGWEDFPHEPGSLSPLPIDYGVRPTMLRGVVAMQVNADRSLSIEVIPDATSTSAFRGFSESKRTYRR